MKLDHLNIGLTSIILIILMVILLVEIGYLDLELKPVESYYEYVDKWIGA